MMGLAAILVTLVMAAPKKVGEESQLPAQDAEQTQQPDADADADADADEPLGHDAAWNSTTFSDEVGIQPQPQ